MQLAAVLGELARSRAYLLPAPTQDGRKGQVPWERATASQALLVPGASLRYREAPSFRGDAQLRWEQLGHPAIFPNILRHATERPSPTGDPTPEEASVWPIDLQIRVPIDDTHTQVYIIYLTPTPDGTLEGASREPTFTRLNVRDENGDFHLETFPSQDEMAWETQGPIAERTVERLGVSDMGIAIWRRLLHEHIKIVQDGGDPMCVFRAYDGVIDVGPSREWNGERYVPKVWEGWGDGKIWTTPNIWLGHESAVAS